MAVAEVAAAAAVVATAPGLGFDGGARSLGCTVLSPARSPGCWGGACKNLGGARDGLTERAGVRGQRARSKGLQRGTRVWEAGRAGPEGPRGGHRSHLSLQPGLCTFSLHPPLPSATPTRGPRPGWAHVELEPALLFFPFLSHLLVALAPSGDPERD